MNNIDFTRGDTYAFKFRRLNADGEPIKEKTQNIWFTVKEDYETDDIVIQKTLDDATFDLDGYYHFIISSKDTRDLRYGEFVYDIQVENSGIVQTIAKGRFILESEVTTDYE